jgi:hypothetical protein
MRRRLYLIGLCLYGLVAVADAAVHLAMHYGANGDFLSPASLAVAVSAGLFWPLDLVARVLLAR